ncbi:MAG: hypothetical protein ACJ72E_09200 [Marmoricola sp.]
MNDFENLTPPPERPLTPAQRARLRLRLPRPDEEERGRPWLLPAAAAAAAVAVGVGGAVALARSVDENDGAQRNPGPAASGPAPTATTPAATVTASTDPCAEVTKGETISGAQAQLHAIVTQGPNSCLSSAPPASCAHEVRDQLPGATEVAGNATDGVSFWTSGQRWTLCFHDASVTTVHRVQTLDAPLVGEQRFAFSTDHGDTVAGHMPSTFVAGGPLGGGDSRISYTFPDGHVQEATYVTGSDGSRWWIVQYVARTGVLADPRTNWGQLAPVVARLWGTDVSAPEKTELPWGASGCNQVNHGC